MIKEKKSICEKGIYTYVNKIFWGLGGRFQSLENKIITIIVTIGFTRTERVKKY